MSVREELARLALPPEPPRVDGRTVTPARKRPKRNPEVAESHLVLKAKKMKKVLDGGEHIS